MNKLLTITLAVMVLSCVSAFAQVADSLVQMPVTPEHGFLERLSGRWNTLVRWWPAAADTHVVEATGRSQTRMTLDGRLLVQTDSTALLGKQFGSMAMLAYDQLKHKFVMTWADNRVTGLLNLTGTLSDSGNVLTMTGDKDQPTGGKSRMKYVYRTFNGNYRVLEIWDARLTGNKADKERELMEIIYTRGR
jgi:hypothetical protein